MQAPEAWDPGPTLLKSSREARYAFSEQEVKQYFTAPKVLAGLFKIIETLFEVAFAVTAPRGIPRWSFTALNATANW